MCSDKKPAGTPRSIRDAIVLAIDEELRRDDSSRMFPDLVSRIEAGVRDVLAQRFGAYTIDPRPEVADAVTRLWADILVPDSAPK